MGIPRVENKVIKLFTATVRIFKCDENAKMTFSPHLWDSRFLRMAKNRYLIACYQSFLMTKLDVCCFDRLITCVFSRTLMISNCAKVGNAVGTSVKINENPNTTKWTS